MKSLKLDLPKVPCAYCGEKLEKGKSAISSGVNRTIEHIQPKPGKETGKIENYTPNCGEKLDGYH